MYSILSSLIINIIYAVISLVLVTISAGYIISAAADYAKKTGISEYIVGFLIVALGTSLPELTTAIVASTTNANNLVLGDLIGGSIIDVTVVLGLAAILGKKIFVRGKVIDRTIFTVILIVMLPLLLGLDGSFSSFDGMILIVSFILYVYNLLKKEGSFGSVKKDLAWKDIWVDMVIVAGCVAALLISAHWFIRSAINIAVILEVPQFIMGLVFVGFMTTLLNSSSK